tara:strand:- start:172 stop:378 length:207 start_codon:yes stop_codon:yes gene_type:complete
LLSQSLAVTDAKVPSQQKLRGLLQYYQNEQLSDAQKIAKSIIEKYPTHPFCWKLLGILIEKMGKNWKL